MILLEKSKSDVANFHGQAMWTNSKRLKPKEQNPKEHNSEQL